MSLREWDIEKHLVERVKALGGEVRTVKWIGRRGAPDRLVMLPATWIKPRAFPYVELGNFSARAIWVELKAPGEKSKPHQAREHERMRRMGQRVEVIDSIQAIEEMLR